MVLNLIVAACAFAALLLFALWMLTGAALPADLRIRALGVVRQRADGLAAMPFQQRMLVPLVESIGRWVASFLPGAIVNRMERRLVLAGRPMTPTVFYTVMLGFGVVIGGTYLLLILAGSDGGRSMLALLPSVLFGAVGMYIPTFWLSAQAKSRQGEMLKGLPDSMDLLTICVEAGLGLDAAFYRVTEKQSGPLVDEMRQMLRELGLGKARRDAMLDFADRTDIEDVRTLANAVIQAEQLGSSLARVLRVQSQRLRVRRRQRAEQAARRVPVKMAFPLVFCLMPSLFIFILGPIVVNLIGFLND